MRITVEYQGTHYCGWQIQPNGVSIQQKLADAVNALTGEAITINGSGRTDAGVHARGQCASFVTASNIPTDRWPKALNTYLPADIAVVEANDEEPGFHARYSALGKKYSYQLYIHPCRSPLLRQYAWHIRMKPDVEMMKKALLLFEGTHDFIGFRAAKSDVLDTVRTIWRADLFADGCSVWMTFQGNGFLYKMVRMMVAAVVQVGIGRETCNDILTRLEPGNEVCQKLVAPPQGLFLDKVYYAETELPAIVMSD